MEAKTKYDIKDNVWLVNENKAVRMFVTGLVVTFTDPDSHDVKYDLNYSLCEIPENKLFKTKEELLESLQYEKTFAITAGDEVWLMHGDHAVCATVARVAYRKFISSLDYESVIEHELYTLSIGGNQLPGLHEKEELFPTKSDLINSL